jgi:hypothetical protein
MKKHFVRLLCLLALHPLFARELTTNGDRFYGTVIGASDDPYWRSYLRELSSHLAEVDDGAWQAVGVKQVVKITPLGVSVLLHPGNPISDFGGFVQELGLLRVDSTDEYKLEESTLICVTRVPFVSGAKWEILTDLHRGPNVDQLKKVGLSYPIKATEKIDRKELRKALVYYGMVPGAEEVPLATVLQFCAFLPELSQKIQGPWDDVSVQSLLAPYSRVAKK